MFISKKIVIFVLGSIFGGSIVKALKSDAFRNSCVKAIGQGIVLKNEAMSIIESAKESAEDMLAEAKNKNESEKPSK